MSNEPYVTRASAIARGYRPPVASGGAAPAATSPSAVNASASASAAAAPAAVAAKSYYTRSDRTCRQRFADWFHYETERVVRIRNAKVSMIHVFAQLLIVVYVVWYGLLYKKAYQATAACSGSSRLKMQGTAYQNGTLPWEGPGAKSSFRIYDAVDLTNPVIERNALFVTSNMWVTMNQTRGRCPSYDVKTNSCNTTTSQCSYMAQTPAGRQIGPNNCLVNYTDPLQRWPEQLPSGGFCELYAWCPTELEPPHEANQFRLEGVENFTIFGRISVRYDPFDEVLDNTSGDAAEGGDDVLTPGLNSWTLEEIVQQTGYKWHEVRKAGIVIALNSRWDCDFDSHSASECVPEISFLRLDDPSSHLSTGVNFRTVEFLHDKYGARELTKRYGIRLIVLIEGIGGRFDLGALLTAVGAGIGLLTIASMAADIIATRLLAEREKYRGAKYEETVIKDPKIKLFSLPFNIPSFGKKTAADGAEAEAEEKEDSSSSSSDDE